jgi:hypothetical protein
VPLNSSDFSSFLLPPQNSKAKIVGLANAGQDTTNSIKRAAEFLIVRQGQKVAGLLMTLCELHGFGLDEAQGLVLNEGFYWDHDDGSRAFYERFFERAGWMPSMIYAATYSATPSYAKAMKAAGTNDSQAVAKKLKELPVDDAFSKDNVLANGRMEHVPVRSHEALGVEDAVGLLKAARGGAGRAGVLHRQGGRLPADELTRSVEPAILRFRVRSFGPSRNDVEGMCSAQTDTRNTMLD